MPPYVLVAFLFLPLGIDCKDALQYFVKNKKIKSFDFTILQANNTTWFEYKYVFDHTVHLNKSTLNVGVIIGDNNKFDCRIGNKSVFEGFSIDVMDWLKLALNISIQYKLIDKKNATKDLIKKNVDVVVCHTNEKTQDPLLLELYPSFKSKHILIYKPLKLNFTKDIFILTFAGSLWLVFLISMIVLAVCLRISTRRYSIMHPKHERWSWVEITLWSIAAACQQGYVMSYLLYTGFAAAITSLLLQYDIYYKLDISNIKSEDLQLICYKDSKDFASKLDERFRKTIYTDNLPQMFKYLEHDNSLAMGPEIIINQFMAENLGYEEIGEYRTSSLSRFNFLQGFYVLRNGGLKEDFNLLLSKMDNNGILFNMLKRQLKPLPASGVNYGYSSAGQEHVGSALLILLAGILSAILFLFAELTYAFYKRNQN